MTYQIAIDIGGTFTDLYIWDGDSGGNSIKTPTTPGNLADGVFNALSEISDQYEMSLASLLDQTDRLIHGTTVATNAIIEDETAKTALLCTDGFRDILTLREGGKEDPYDWDKPYPDPYVPRSLTFEIDERVNSEGGVVNTLNTEEVIRKLNEIEQKGADAIAVSLLWAHTNPAHEEQIGELIEEHTDNLEYSLSSKVCPIVREYRRTSATCINASLKKVVNAYLENLEARLRDNGYRGPVLLITANGGVMQIKEVKDIPIWTVDAGPTMLPIATKAVANDEDLTKNIISLDMGGTSTDIGVVSRGAITRSRDSTVGNEYMLGIEKAHIRSIGAGGGSIAWVDEAGLLHVGPKSAGADPGPVCYDQGGVHPTVTDAALVLGYLNPDYFLGGKMELNQKKAKKVIRDKIGSQLGLGAEEAAYAVFASANQNMINGVKELTIERGIDPQDYLLSGGGGALGTHVVPIAEGLNIDKIVLPRDAGVVSAYGGLESDIRRDFSESQYTTGSDFDYNSVNEILDNLRQKATSFFDRANIGDANRSTSYYVEARYPQQIWELDVGFSSDHFNEDAIEDLIGGFHEKHQSRYGYKMPDQDVEFLNWRIEAVGQNPSKTRSKLTSSFDNDKGRGGTRDAYFDGEYVETPYYRGDSLERIDIKGPALIDDELTTIVLPPDKDLIITGFGNYRINL